MNRRNFLLTTTAAPAAAVSAAQQAQPPVRRTQNVFLISTDGLRWQDVFRGADPKLKDPKKPHIHERYAKREDLMPFLWSTIAKQGQIWGNRDRKSDAWVTNNRNFSYPGYNELLTGAPDDRIDSNAKKNNPNINVFEWLTTHNPARFRNRVAGFGAWDCFPYILNSERASRTGMLVNAGYDPYPNTTFHNNPTITLLNRLRKETAVWEGEPLDAPVFHTALEHVKMYKPRALYLALGETDEWAHAGNYDLYLHAAHRVDNYIQQLWETTQAMDEYRGTTTFIIAVDHGRGEAENNAWRSHGEKHPDSKYVWFALMGPDTPALGERSDAPPVTQSQVAATVAALLGEDFNAFSPKAGKPFPQLWNK